MAKRATKTVTPTRAIVPKPASIVTLDNTARLLEAIIRTAADPKANVTKMQQLNELYERMQARADKVAYDNALSQMQPELPIIDRKGRIEIRKKDPKTGERTGPIEQSTAYARWEDIAETITPILHKYGFSLSFRTPADTTGKISVTGILARAGHREETTLPFQHDSTGSKNAAQAIVSATSYGKRTVACLLLNIITRGEDDDAKASAGLEPISQERLAELLKLVEDSGADKIRFCALFKVDNIADIPALRFKEAKAQLMRKLKDKEARVAAAKAKMASDFPGDKPMASDFPGDKPMAKDGK
jgi:hypothetical protein